jgi:DNA-binding transcriptional LysR family regulator
VSINTNVPFGLHVLIPLVSKLLERHPGLSVELTLTDKVIDPVEEGVDIAIRWGKLKSSDLVARRLGETRQAIVASPAYLERHGTPRTAKDLERHNRLGFTYLRIARGWPLRSGRHLLHVPVSGIANASDGEAVRALVLAGVGLARLFLFHIQPDLDAHRLVSVLEQLNPLDLEPIHAVYVGRADRLPSRVTAVLDFLETHAFPRKNAKRN